MGNSLVQCWITFYRDESAVSTILSSVLSKNGIALTKELSSELFDSGVFDYMSVIVL